MRLEWLSKQFLDNVHCGISIGEKSLIQLLCISMFRIPRNNMLYMHKEILHFVCAVAVDDFLLQDSTNPISGCHIFIDMYRSKEW